MEKDLLNTVNEVELKVEENFCPMCGADLTESVYNCGWDDDDYNVSYFYKDFICKECGAKGYMQYKVEYKETILFDD